jgi:hypothetical protein
MLLTAATCPDFACSCSVPVAVSTYILHFCDDRFFQGSRTRRSTPALSVEDRQQGPTNAFRRADACSSVEGSKDRRHVERRLAVGGSASRASRPASNRRKSASGGSTSRRYGRHKCTHACVHPPFARPEPNKASIAGTRHCTAWSEDCQRRGSRCANPTWGRGRASVTLSHFPTKVKYTG